MRFAEIDWRYASTKSILLVLSEALDAVEDDLATNQLGLELDDILDYAESLLGMAFVAAQTYIAGTVSDANELVGSGSRLTKEQLFKGYSDTVAGSTVTKMEVCDAIANYFKHHDEWDGWTANSRNQKTISVLRAAGIDENENFLCRRAADLLWSNAGSDFAPLLSMISSWREVVVAACKK